MAKTASKEAAKEKADAYFNLGAFAFNGGRRRGLFLRTSQFSEAIQYLNAFLRFHFPAGTWPSICVSHNVRTILHTDSGNEPNSSNHTVSLGNFAGGAVWMRTALDAQAPLVPAPAESATRECPAPSEVLGQVIDTWEKPTTF